MPFSCYVNEIPLSSSYTNSKRNFGTDYTPYMLDHSTLTAICCLNKINAFGIYKQVTGISPSAETM